jgi:hypothetical protein
MPQMEQSMNMRCCSTTNVALTIRSPSMLFAAESSGNFSFLLFVIIMVLGTRQWIKWLKGNDALRGAAKKGLRKGADTILSRILK